MVETAAVASPGGVNPVLQKPFVKELIRQWRAQDAHGAWDGKTDVDLLEPYILDKEKRRQMPIIGDPDPETLWRLELFYNAVGLVIERDTGIMVSAMMKIHHEGFGRLALTPDRQRLQLLRAFSWRRVLGRGGPASVQRFSGRLGRLQSGGRLLG